MAKRTSRIEGYRQQQTDKQDETKRQFLRLRLLADDEQEAKLGKRPSWRRLKNYLKRTAVGLLTTDR